MRLRNLPVPLEVSSLLRSPRRYISRSLVTELSPAVSTLCCAELRLPHSKGMPPLPLQVKMLRLVGPSAVVDDPVAWQLPPVSMQLASQVAVGLIETMLPDKSSEFAVSWPHQLPGW